MAAGLNAWRPSKASWVTKNDSEINFTSKGKELAETIADKQIEKSQKEIGKLADKAISNYATQLKNDLNTKTYESVIKKYNHFYPNNKDRISYDNLHNEFDHQSYSSLVSKLIDTTDTGKQGLKERTIKTITTEKRAAIIQDVLNQCTGDYNKEQFEKEVFRRVSHIARVPLFVLGTLVQFTKTLFKAVIISIPAEIYNAIKNSGESYNLCKKIGFTGVRTDIVYTIALAIKTFGCFNPTEGTSSLSNCKGIARSIGWETVEYSGFAQTPLKENLFQELVKIFGQKL